MMSDSPDWSNALPEDILGEIALKLDFVQHFIYFSAVCRSWHRAYAKVKEIWSLRKTMPWLLLAESDSVSSSSTSHYRNLFCPINKRCYQLKLPETFGAACWGSPCGWIVTLDLNLEFHLLNPFTQARLALPPQPTMSHPKEFQEEDDRVWLRQFYVDKMLVFNIDDDCIVMALHGAVYGYLAYARPGDQAWTPLLPSENIVALTRPCACAQDVVQYGSHFFFLFYTGMLGYCDVSELQPQNNNDCQPPIVREYLPPPLKIVEELYCMHRTYLVDSFGDLLMIIRYKDTPEDENDELDEEIYYETIDFEVYKLNFGTKTWEPVTDLGDVALFVGNHSTMSVRASTFTNCKRNSIYFTDDEWQFWHIPTRFGGHDFGIFDMEEGEVEEVYQGDDVHSNFCPPIWFMPKFF